MFSVELVLLTIAKLQFATLHIFIYNWSPIFHAQGWKAAEIPNDCKMQKCISWREDFQFLLHGSGSRRMPLWVSNSGGLVLLLEAEIEVVCAGIKNATLVSNSMLITMLKPSRKSILF